MEFVDVLNGKADMNNMRSADLMAATSACSLSACPAFFFLLASGFLGAGRASTSFAHAVKVLYLNKFQCILLHFHLIQPTLDSFRHTFVQPKSTCFPRERQFRRAVYVQQRYMTHTTGEKW